MKKTIFIFMSETTHLSMNDFMLVDVKIFYNYQSFKDKLEHSTADGLLVERMVFSALSEQQMEYLQKFYFSHIATVFIAECASTESCVQSATKDGIATCVYPLSGSEVEQVFSTHWENRDNKLMRVLIVDDDPASEAYFSYVLKKVGIFSEVVTNPYDVFENIYTQDPDLLIIDLYMPICDGVELTKAIRQKHHFLSLPIVFLSGESNQEIQAKTYECGADQFVQKTVSPRNFTTLIQAMIKRAKAVRMCMECDSMTGLYKHENILDKMNIEINRASRENWSLSSVMLDIDHFKKVNDQYGHAIGDVVIKSLAQLLKDNLRSSDIVGRYGGEEFAIILPNTSLHDAVKVMDNLREKFSNIAFQYEGEAFNCTLSCGVSEYDFKHKNQFKDADEQLYIAKSSGRNCIRPLLF